MGEEKEGKELKQRPFLFRFWVMMMMIIVCEETETTRISIYKGRKYKCELTKKKTLKKGTHKRVGEWFVYLDRS